MNTDIVKLRDQVISMTDDVSMAAAWLAFLNVESLMKTLKVEMKARSKEIMTEGKFKEVRLSDTVKVCIMHKKTDRFATDAIYTALAFTDEQIKVLPKNPAWKKTAILANEKTSPAHYIEETDEVEAKLLDERFLK